MLIALQIPQTERARDGLYDGVNFMSLHQGCRWSSVLEPNIGVVAQYLQPKPLYTKKLAAQQGALFTIGILHTRAAMVPSATIFRVAL